MKMNLTQTPNQQPLLYLPCPPAAIALAEQEATHHTNNHTAWTAYLNALSVETLLPWLRETSGESCTVSQPELSSLWEFLDGTAITMGETRLVIIPTEEEICETFSVSQEWVDIPEFAADYYLFVRIELDEEDCGLEVLGYTTHQDCKTIAGYDSEERCYHLSPQEITEDITLLFLARQLVGSRQVSLTPLPPLSETTAAALLDQLSAEEVLSPRLSLPWTEWGALISDSQWRGELYQRRLSQVTEGQETALERTSQDVATPLQNWFNTVTRQVQNLADQSWQTVEELLETLQQPEFAYRFAGTPHFRDGAAGFPQAVPGLLALLKSDPDKETMLSALYLLGQIGFGHSEAIAVLSEQIETVRDGDIRRQAAVSLGKIDPNHPQAGVRRVKMLDLGMRLDQTRVSLIVTLLPEAHQRMNVHLRVCPLGDVYLPEHLKLVVLDENGHAFQQEQARKTDIAMQLSFRLQKGDRFAIKIALNEYSMTEQFVMQGGVHE